jgi:hypothetical protein
MQQKTKQGPLMKNGNFVSKGGGKKNGGRRRRNRSKDGKGQSNLSLNRIQVMPGSTANFFRVKAASTPGGVRCEGRELVSALTLTSTSTGVFQLLTFGAGGASSGTTFYLHPSSFTRLVNYDTIYEQYKFLNCRIVFRPNQPTTVAGEIVGCTEYNVLSESVPGNTANIMAHIDSDMANIYSAMGFSVRSSECKLNRYSTGTSGDNGAVEFQATIFVGAEGFTGTGGATLGYLLIEYDCEFYAPA